MPSIHSAFRNIRLLVSLLSIGVCTSAFAQVSLEEMNAPILIAQSSQEVYKVSYDLESTSTDSTLIHLHTAMTLLHKIDNDSSYIRALVNAQKIRVEENGLSPFVQVSDLTDSLSYQFYTEYTDFTPSRIARQVPLSNTPISFGVFQGESSGFTSDKLTLELTDETKLIAGYTCHLARFKRNERVEIWVWYVKDLPKLFWAGYDYLQQISGLPLQIESRTVQSHYNFKILAKTIEKVKVDAALFEVPDEYIFEEKAKD